MVDGYEHLYICYKFASGRWITWIHRVHVTYMSKGTNTFIGCKTLDVSNEKLKCY